MSTQFTNRQWRLPNNENKDKQSNYSMDFERASASYIDLGTIDITGSCTISFWINFNSISHAYQKIFFAGTSASDQFSIGFATTNQGVAVNTIFASGQESAAGTKSLSNNSISTNTWYNVVITKTTGVVQNMYLNGVNDTNTPSGFWWGGAPNVTRIGDSGGNSLDAKLDGVAIFDYVLSSSQITTLYGSSSTGIGNPMSLSPKPVAYYPLGDQDAFNGANYLVPNSSLKDYVFDFDASSSNYIDCGNDSSLSPSSFTFSLWSKSDLSNVGWFTKYSSENYGFGIYGSVIFLNIKTSAGWGGLSVSKSTYLTANTWHHIVGTYDETDLKIYIDGNLAGSLAKAGPITYSSRNTRIGALEGNSTFYLNGQLSNVSIWNTALTDGTGGTPNQIETIYNNGSPSDISSLNPVSWWKLDASDTYDGTNWTIEDHAGSNDGTSSGMTQANLVQSDLSFTSGYSPFALDFDGVNNYIDFNSIDLGTTNTISFWHKRGNTTSNQNIIGSLDGTQNNIIYFTLGYIYVRPDGSTQFITAYLANTPYPFAPYKNTTDWANYIITRSGDNIKLYLNGVEFALSGSGSGMAATTVNRIGTKGNSVSNTIDGSLSNVSVWNTALTQAQVTEIYNQGVPSNLNNHSAYSNLVSWWQLGSNSSFNTNWTVLDEKGSNNGTSVNMGEDAIVDGVGSYVNGVGTSGLEVVGSAPFSDANSLSVNMDVLDRSTDVPN